MVEEMVDKKRTLTKMPPLTETESKVEACGEDSGTENLNTPGCVTVVAAEGDQHVNEQIQNRKGGLNQWKNYKVAADRYAS